MNSRVWKGFFLAVLFFFLAGCNTGISVTTTTTSIDSTSTTSTTSTTSITDSTTTTSNLPMITIHFESNGGSLVDAFVLGVGSSFNPPEEPSKEGHTFIAWFTDEALTNSFSIGQVVYESMTLYAMWQVNSYTVLFVDYDNTVFQEREYEYGDTIIPLQEPPVEREGYTFTSWSPVVPQTMPAYNVTFKAQYEVIQCTVFFADSDGTVLFSIELDYSSLVQEPTAPVKMGHTFLGWYEDQNLTRPYAFNLRQLKDDMTLYAKWDVMAFTFLILDYDGSDLVRNYIYFDSDLTSYGYANYTPTRTGYTFLGFDKEIPARMPDHDVIFYAQYRPNSYTITFESNGGSEIEGITQDVDTVITLPIPEKTGYRFVGWFTNPSLDHDFTDTLMPAENKTLHAKWEVNQYTLSFETYGGTTIPSITRVYQGSIQSVNQPEKQGHTFAGWFIDEAYTTPYTFGQMPAYDFTIYAKWNVNSYNLRYVDDNQNELASFSVPYGSDLSTFEEPTPSKVGHTFTGWDQSKPSVMPDHDITIKATYQLNQYTISFETNGGSTIEDIVAMYGYAVFQPASPLKEGHTFGGWYKDSNFLTTYTFTAMPAEDIIVYAKWNINSYTLQFIDDKGLVLQTHDVPYQTSLTDVNPPVVNKIGYTFTGWDIVLPPTMPAENLTIQAQYKINTFEVTFKDYDGSIIETQTVDYGQAAIAPTQPNRLGYSFTAWNQAFNLITSDLVITATYQINRYEVTFKDYDGSIIETQTVDYGQAAVAPTQPARLGYTFTAWDQAFNVITTNLVITATYQINRFEVTFKDYDGSVIETQMVDYGQAAVAPTQPARLGYTFTAWDQAFNVITTNLVITATYQINRFEVTFKDYDGSVIETQMVDYGQAAVAPGNPTRTGYTFTGWNEDYHIVTTSKDIIAQYSINQYSITFGVVSDDYDSLQHILLLPDETIIQIASGDDHYAVLTSLGRVFIWGNNGSGQLGDGTTTTKSTPIEITSRFSLTSYDKITQISLGAYHSSALTLLGRIFTWGYNEDGQLGNATYTTSTTPIEITSQFNLSLDDPIIQVSLGGYHSSALTTSGRLFMWGRNNEGQLGNNSQIQSNRPIEISNQFTLDSPDKVVQISLGDYFSSALTHNGQLYLWGLNQYGQLGDTTNDIYQWNPQNITENFNLSPGDRIIQVELGSSHSAALSLQGRLFMWGQNISFQLGDNSNINKNIPIDITEYFDIESDDLVIQVSLGGRHSSALTLKGRVFTWGSNGTGQLGDSTTQSRYTPTEITSQFTLDENDTIIRVFLGAWHSSAFTQSGYLYLWGSNGTGQLGNGTLISRYLPLKGSFRFYETLVTKYFDYDEVINDSVSTKLGYMIQNWYTNKQLSSVLTLQTMPDEHLILYSKWTLIDYSIDYVLDGSLNDELNPSSYDILDQIEFNNPIKEGYTFVGWYSNASFEGNPVTSILPNTVGDITLYAKLVINQYTITYGNMPEDYDPLLHIALNTDETIVQIELGGYHSSLLTSQGRLFVWGQGTAGQLGHGSYLNKMTPVEITNKFSLNNGDRIISVSLGAYHSAALTATGRLFLWGSNTYGQLGNKTYNHQASPIDITQHFNLLNGEKITQIDLGGFHSAAVTSLGRLFTWGTNANGVIGDLSIAANRNRPTNITNQFTLDPNDSIVSVSLSINNSSALTVMGRLFVWGNNNYGQIGNNTTSSSNKPIEVTDNFNLELNDQIIAVSLGELHSSALTLGGRLFMWGYNANGELGDGSTTNKLLPTEITANFSLSMEEQITQISMGYVHSSAITSLGRIFLWGRNIEGGIGDSTTISRSIPTEIISQFDLRTNETITMVSLGGYHSATLTSNGRHYVWGYNYYGEVGDGQTSNYHSPFRSYFRVFEVLSTELYNYGDTVELITPEKIGFTFNGWYTDITLSTPYNQGTLVLSDSVLYAKWTVNQYTISFEMNGGSYVHPMTQDYNSGVLEPSEPIKEGYSFAGWYLDADFNVPYQFHRMPAENIVVYAKWNINS